MVRVVFFLDLPSLALGDRFFYFFCRGLLDFDLVPFGDLDLFGDLPLLALLNRLIFEFLLRGELSDLLRADLEFLLCFERLDFRLLGVWGVCTKV